MKAHSFPEPGRDFVGCLSCHCGDVVKRLGPIAISPVLEAQQRAGEEDQSVPGWDHGA